VAEIVNRVDAFVTEPEGKLSCSLIVMNDIGQGNGAPYLAQLSVAD